jgi:glycosyltransferase involved in cell wall biosynthesis
MNIKKVDNLDLSVVVITQNESFVIDKCIKSLIIACDNNYASEKYEIILIDSMSNDNTVDIAKKLLIKKKVVNWTLIKYESSTHTAALGREIGKKYAKGEDILFLDGDMLIFSKFLTFVKSEKKLFDNNLVGIVGTRIDIFYDSNYNIKYFRKFNRKINRDKFTTNPGGGLFLFNSNIINANYNVEQIAREEEAFAKKLLAEGKKIKYFEQNMYLHLNYKQNKRNLLKRVFMVKDVSQSYVIAIKKHFFEYGFKSMIQQYKGYILYNLSYPIILLTGLVVSLVNSSSIIFIIILLMCILFIYREKLNALNVLFFSVGLFNTEKVSYRINYKLTSKDVSKELIKRN